MSFTTFLGVVFGFGLFILSIAMSTDNYLIFLSFSSALMVIGGTLAATLIGQEARYVWLALRGIIRIFMVQRVGRNILNRHSPDGFQTRPIW